MHRFLCIFHYLPYNLYFPLCQVLPLPVIPLLLLLFRLDSLMFLVLYLQVRHYGLSSPLHVVYVHFHLGGCTLQAIFEVLRLLEQALGHGEELLGGGEGDKLG